MRHKAAMAFQPALHFRSFVRAIIVQHQVQFPVSGKLSVQTAQELQEFLMAVPTLELPHDFAVQHAQRRELGRELGTRCAGGRMNGRHN